MIELREQIKTHNKSLHPTSPKKPEKLKKLAK